MNARVKPEHDAKGLSLVIPAQAGIQGAGTARVPLDTGFRRYDETPDRHARESGDPVTPIRVAEVGSYWIARSSRAMTREELEPATSSLPGLTRQMQNQRFP